MGTQVTVRLSDDLADRVDDAAERLRLKRSDIVRLALDRFLGETLIAEQPAPYEKVRHLIGSVRSGIADLGSAHREHLVRRLKRRG